MLEAAPIGAGTEARLTSDVIFAGTSRAGTSVILCWNRLVPLLQSDLLDLLHPASRFAGIGVTFLEVPIARSMKCCNQRDILLEPKTQGVATGRSVTGDGGIFAGIMEFFAGTFPNFCYHSLFGWFARTSALFLLPFVFCFAGTNILNCCHRVDFC